MMQPAGDGARDNADGLDVVDARMILAERTE